MSKIQKNYLIFDCEVFPEWWCVVVSTLDGFQIHYTSDDDCLIGMKNIFDNSVLTGFNIKNYDMKIIDAIMHNFTPERIYQLSKNIIEDKPDSLNSITFWNNYCFTDLMDDWKNGSLKEYESNKGLSIKESSIPFDKKDLTEDEKKEILYYCKHDVYATSFMFKDRLPYLNAKLELANLFNINPIKALKCTNAKLSSIILNAKKQNREEENDYVIPENIKTYIEKYIPKEILKCFEKLNDDEKSFKIYENDVVFGIGGIHSTYSNNISTKSTTDFQLINVDVTSYYPNLLMHFNYMSRNVSKPELYNNIYELRKKLKKESTTEKELNGDSELFKKLDAAQTGLKLILNTVYGAMKNKYNDLYDPYRAGSLCYTGQLLLAALANNLYLEVPEIKIIQTNTDGILVKCKKTEIEHLKEIVSYWEKMVGFTMEYDYIKAFYQRDVNNYIEVTNNEKSPFKLKGKWSNQAFIEKVASNLNAPITHKALLEYYINETPIEKTINECNSIIEFCFTTKTGKTYNETVYEYDSKFLSANKVNRVVATLDLNKGTLYKYKPDVDGPPQLDNPFETDEKKLKLYDRKLKTWTKKKETFEELYKRPFGRMDKVAEIPEHCELLNDELKMIDALDRAWYVNYCKDKLKTLQDV